MSWGGIKLEPADILWSKYIRKKHRKCEMCGKLGTGEDGITGLECAHYKGRRRRSVRFYEPNCLCLCIGCHRKCHEDPDMHCSFMKKKLGERGYEILIVQANVTQKKDKVMEKMYAKACLDDLENPKYTAPTR